jgi:hypothetical protein
LYSVKRIVNGTIYCEKEESVKKTKLAGKITSIEEKTNKAGVPYYAIFILNAGEEESLRWNYFSPKGKVFKKNDLIIAEGVFYSENKRLIRSMRKAK